MAYAEGVADEATYTSPEYYDTYHYGSTSMEGQSWVGDWMQYDGTSSADGGVPASEYPLRSATTALLDDIAFAFLNIVLQSLYGIPVYSIGNQTVPFYSGVVK